MALFNGPHQRRRGTHALFGIHVGAGGDEHFDRGGVSVTSREHDRRLAVRPALFRVCARFDQLLDHRGIAIQGRHEQRRGALTVRRLDVGAGLYQKIRGRQIIPVHRPVQRRGTVYLGSIHVGFRQQQLASRRGLTPHDCVGDVAPGAADEGRRAHEQDRNPADDLMSIHSLSLPMRPSYRCEKAPTIAG